MKTRVMILSGALALASGAVPGSAPVRADEKPKAAPSSVDLSGRWIFNRDLSDDARQKMREGMERGGGPGGRGPGGGGMGGDDDRREAMRAILEPAEELAIAESGTEIAIDEKFGRTRRLHPDGKKYKTDNGASEIKTSWKEGRLVVETKPVRGGGVVESWELVPDGSRLIVNVKMQGGLGPSVELKRIYDRAKDEAAK